MSSEIQTGVMELQGALVGFEAYAERVKQASDKLLRAVTPTIKAQAFTPPPIVPLFLHDRTIDAVLCQKSKGVTHFAWMRGDKCIEINSFDVNSEKPWKPATCQMCIQHLRDTIKSRAFPNSVIVPRDFFTEFIPPSAPFTFGQVIAMTRSHTAPIFNYAWIRSDSYIEMAAFNMDTMRYMESLDKDSLEWIKWNIRSRGVTNKFFDEMPDPWNPSGNSFYEDYITGGEPPVIYLPRPESPVMGELVERKPEEVAPKELVWMPSVQQVMLIHRWKATMNPTRNLDMARQKRFALGVITRYVRYYSEEELDTFDENLPCLYMADSGDRDMAVKILLECYETYDPKQSQEEKYNAMVETSKRLFDEWIEEEESEDSGVSAEEEKRMLDEFIARVEKVKEEDAKMENLKIAVKTEAVKEGEEKVKTFQELCGEAQEHHEKMQKGKEDSGEEKKKEEAPITTQSSNLQMKLAQMRESHAVLRALLDSSRKSAEEENSTWNRVKGLTTKKEFEQLENWWKQPILCKPSTSTAASAQESKVASLSSRSEAPPNPNFFRSVPDSCEELRRTIETFSPYKD